METDRKRDFTSPQYVTLQIEIRRRKVKTCQCGSGSFGSTFFAQFVKAGKKHS
jgi:hypothetical protein